MNAAHVALFLSFSGHGGVERMVANLAGGLARRGLRVDLVLARTAGGHAGAWPEGVRVVTLGTRHTHSALPALVAYLRRERPVAVLAAKDRAIRVAVVARRLAGVPLRLVGRCPAGQKSAVLQIVGESGAQKRDMVFALDLADAEDGGEGLRREWLAQKIYKLINDRMAGGRAEETVQEIRDLSIRHNVPLPYGADFPM